MRLLLYVDIIHFLSNFVNKHKNIKAVTLCELKVTAFFILLAYQSECDKLEQGHQENSL